MKQVQGEDYSISYDDSTATIVFRGQMRLQGTAEYASIEELLEEVLTTSSKLISLDMCDLEFLNSSGINVILKFAFKVRDLPMRFSLLLRANSQVMWQSRMLSNLQRLMPNVKVQYN